MKYIAKVNFFETVQGSEVGFFKIDKTIPYQGELPPFYGDINNSREVIYYVEFDLAPVIKIDGRKILIHHYLCRGKILAEHISTGRPLFEVRFNIDESYPKIWGIRR